MLALCKVSGMAKVAQVLTSPAALVFLAQYPLLGIWRTESWSQVRKLKTSPEKPQFRFQGTLGKAHPGSSFLKPSSCSGVIGTDGQEDNEETGLYQLPTPLAIGWGCGLEHAPSFLWICLALSVNFQQRVSQGRSRELSLCE